MVSHLWLPVSSELMTYVSEGCSLALVLSNALPVLLRHIANSNRSSASLLVVQSAIKILINVTKVGRYMLFS